MSSARQSSPGAVTALVSIVVAAVVLSLGLRDTYAGSGDEPHYLVIAESIAFDGDLDLANNYRQATVVHPGDLDPEPHADKGRGDRLRPLHDIGLPLIFAPYVRAAAAVSPSAAVFRGAIVVALSVLAALLAVQFLSVFRRMGLPPLHAAGWALLLTLSPPLVSHAFLFFPQMVAALLVLWLFRVLGDPGTTALKRPALACAAGAAAGFLLLLDRRNVTLTAGFAAWGGVQLRRDKARTATAVAFAAGVAVPVLVRGLVYFLFWGSPVGALDVGTDWWTLPGEILSETFVRISGLFLDQEFGVVWYAPIYLLMLAGLVRINERSRPEGRALVRIVVLYLIGLVLPYLNPVGWIGGWAPAGHLLTPVAPLLGVAVVTCAWRLAGVARAFAYLLIGAQVVIDLLLWMRPALLWNDGDGSNDFFRALPSLQRIIPVWHGPAPSPTPFIVAGLIWAAVSVYLSRNSHAHRS